MFRWWERYTHTNTNTHTHTHTNTHKHTRVSYKGECKSNYRNNLMTDNGWWWCQFGECYTLTIINICINCNWKYCIQPNGQFKQTSLQVQRVYSRAENRHSEVITKAGRIWAIIRHKLCGRCSQSSKLPRVTNIVNQIRSGQKKQPLLNFYVIK